MNIIRQEKPNYLTMLTRKSSLTKIIESTAFVFLILILSLSFGYEHPFFKTGAILSAVLILGSSPFLYKLIVKPKYTLAENKLIIEKFNVKQEIPIGNINYSNDLKIFYILNGKKTALTVSNNFLQDLNYQIEIMKKKK